MATAKPEPKVRGVFEKKKGSGVWWINYYENGRQRRERAGSKSVAKTLYQKRKTQIATGEKLPELNRKRHTFGELLDDAIDFANENHKHPEDVKNKAELVRPSFGQRTAESVTSADIDAWIRKRKLSPATQNRYKAFFSLVFREAIHNKKIDRNPAKLVRRKRESDGRKRYLSRAEYEDLLNVVNVPKAPHRRVALIVSVLTGMRLTEQFTLEWEAVDFARNEINLSDTKNGSDRTIPMLPAVREALREQFERTGKGKKKTSLVFARPREGKGPVQPEWFEKALAAAKIEHYTWHNNRHTFCSWYMMAGGELLELRQIAGHKTISITARYSHLSPGHLKSGMDRLGRMAEAPSTAEVVQFPTGTKTGTRA